MKFSDLFSAKITTTCADSCVLYAAEELKRLIADTTGANPAIVPESGICGGKAFRLGVGKDGLPDGCPQDSFSVRFDKDGAFFTGARPRATLYAVYDFAERFLGVRFLSPDYTYAPEIREFCERPVSYTSVPDFPLRQFLAKNVENEKFSARLRLYSENYRIKAEYGGGLRWNGRYGCNHSLLNMVSKSVYFAEDVREKNAHLYQLNGKGEPVDICMSDGITDDGEIDGSMETSAFKIVLSALKELISATDDEYFSIGQMDHTDECTCEKCVRRAKKYTRAGLNVIFGNLLLRELREWMKEKGIERNIYLVFFAYNYSTLAPVKRENGKVTPLVKADPNLCVRICPIRANCYFPLNSDMHVQPLERIIREWKTVCDRVMVWTYHCQYHAFLWYFPTMQKWDEELRFYKSLGVEYMFMQSNHLESADWKANMELYVASKKLWDVNADVVKIRDEYLDLTFGSCAKYVKRIIEIFDENYALIASRSEKVRKRIYREVNGEDFKYGDETATFEICEKLDKEAAAEWTKNVYFGVYGPEIGWYENQPSGLLEKQAELLELAKDEARGLPDCARIVAELEKIELTVRFMTLFNYKLYYGEDGYEKYKAEFVALFKKTGWVKIGEGYVIDDVKDNLKLNYWL